VINSFYIIYTHMHTRARVRVCKIMMKNVLYFPM